MIVTPAWRRLRASCILLGMVAALALPPRTAAAQQPPAAAGQAPAAAGASAPHAGFASGPSQQISTPGLGPLFGSPFGEDHLFGDWGGTRTWLNDHGVVVNLDWLTENAGNITGGQREAFSSAGQTGLEIDLDLEKLLGLRGSAFHVMIVNRTGRNVSTDAIGDDLATVQEIYGGGGNVLAHLVYSYWEQSVDHDRIDLVGGWLPVGTYFAASPLYCRFMNVLFCGNPHPLPNYPGEQDWPQATFGGQIRWIPIPQLYLMAGLHSVDIDFGTGGGGISGWAWADPHKSGISIPLEAGWVPRLGAQNLIGHYKVGYDRDTHSYADVSGTQPDGAPAAGHYRDTFYVLADQMLLRQGKAATDGVIALAGYVHSSPRVSPLAQHAFAGLLTTGAPWGRPKDFAGVDFQWLEMSAGFTRAQEAAGLLGTPLPLSLDGFGAAYGPQNTEQVIELDYNVAVYRGVTVLPDFQYLIRPGATTRTPDAAVLGFRTNINF